MICFRCKKHIISSAPHFPGYARDSRNNLICYACCGELDREQLETEDRAVLYLTYRQVTSGGGIVRMEWNVGNWPGSLKLPAAVSLSKGRGFGGEYPRRNVWFVGPDGDHWYGQNQGDNDLVYCRRLKHKQPWIDIALGE